MAVHLVFSLSREASGKGGALEIKPETDSGIESVYSMSGSFV